MTTKTVWLYVLDTMSDWEPAYAVSGIGSTPFQLRPGEYVVRTASIGGRPVTTMGGVRILPDAALGDISPEGAAMLIVPGGATWDDDSNREAVEACSEVVVEAMQAMKLDMRRVNQRRTSSTQQSGILCALLKHQRNGNFRESRHDPWS